MRKVVSLKRNRGLQKASGTQHESTVMDETVGFPSGEFRRSLLALDP
jgi:hypothetical protein